MEIYWGIATIVIGLFLLFSSLTRSNFIVYRLFVYRSKMLWGENVHSFYIIISIIIIVLGLLMTTGFIGN